MTRSLLQPYDVIIFIIIITESPREFTIYNLRFTIYNPETSLVHQVYLMKNEGGGKLETSLVPHVYLMKNEGGGKPETRNPKPETRNPKPETRNPKHKTYFIFLNTRAVRAGM